MSTTSSHRGRNWAGIVVPAVLALALLGDGLARFASLDRFTVRAWEAMTRNGSAESGIPFEPSKRYENDRAYGDQATSHNRVEMRDYHREVFTSDRFGFRNLEPFSREHAPNAILVGTSFSVGCGVSDDETLAVRLGARTGLRIYNGAGTPSSPDYIRTIAQRFGVERGTVFLELLGGVGYPSFPAGPPSRLNAACLAHLGSACLYAKGWLWVSPLEIVSHRSYRWFQDDRWLPNTPAAELPPTFVGGVPLLYDKQPLDCPEIAPDAARVFFSRFRAEVAPLDPFVFLLPSKFMVYSPLAASGPKAPLGTPAGSCFAVMRRAMDELGVRYIDLTTPLQEAARDALARKQLIYFGGDNHWNPAGIDLAARLIAEAWARR
jgi:hypothetical protein